MNLPWLRQRKIATLPIVKDPSPQLVLGRSLEKAGRMKGVVVTMLWDDGTIDLDWSVVDPGTLAMLGIASMNVISDKMRGI